MSKVRKDRVIKLTVRYIELIVLILLALISDVKTYKIKNFLVLPFILIGLATNSFLEGFGGVSHYLLAAFLPLLLLLILFAARMLGAGDIKLFSAVGAIMGVRFVLYCMAYSFLSGGIIALALIILRKNGKERLNHLLKYLKLCLVTFSIQPYADFKEEDGRARFHFTFAIACGVIITYLIEK